MFVDILKFTEDSENICYVSDRIKAKPNIYLVHTATLSVELIVAGDSHTAIGGLRKLKMAISDGNFPEKIFLATG